MTRFEDGDKLDHTKIKGVKRCLIIDDNSSNRIAISNLLEIYNMNYYMTASGEEAILSYLNNVKRLKTIDFALIDIRMPGMDGNMVINRIYDIFKEYSLSFPCIAMNSGDDDISDKFNVVLTKPIVEKKLIKTLIDLLPNKNANKIKKEKSIIIQKIFNTNINILIAEDNFINQKVILNCLLTLGIPETNIEIVDNGSKAYDKFIESPSKYDYILLDMIMPILDGPSTGKKIYDFKKINNMKTSAIKYPKIIGISALAMSGDREKYMKEGHFDDYLYKPIDLDILRKCFT
jgi:CheY-like chemotaxis protein